LIARVTVHLPHAGGRPGGRAGHQVLAIRRRVRHHHGGDAFLRHVVHGAAVADHDLAGDLLRDERAGQAEAAPALAVGG